MEIIACGLRLLAMFVICIIVYTWWSLKRQSKLAKCISAAGRLPADLVPASPRGPGRGPPEKDNRSWPSVSRRRAGCQPIRAGSGAQPSRPEISAAALALYFIFEESISTAS